MKEIKQIANLLYGRHFGLLLSISLLESLLQFAIAYVSAYSLTLLGIDNLLFEILMIVIAALSYPLLVLGVTQYYYNIAQGQAPDWAALLTFCKNRSLFMKSFGLGLIAQIIYRANEIGFLISKGYLGFILTLIGIWLVYRFFLLNYLWVMEGERALIPTVRISEKRIRGHMLSVIYCNISLKWWLLVPYILCFSIFGDNGFIVWEAIMIFAAPYIYLGEILFLKKRFFPKQEPLDCLALDHGCDDLSDFS